MLFNDIPVELLLNYDSICSQSRLLPTLPSIGKKMENKKVGFEVLEGYV